jgi:hypothetical protein
MLRLMATQAAAQDGSKHDKVACRLLLTRLEKKALISFRQAWVRQRRVWKILTRGKLSPEIDVDRDQLNRVIPERDRTSKKMRQTGHLTIPEMREAIQDFYTLCIRNNDVFYRPGEEPLEGLCPVCDEDIEQ